MSIRKAMIFMLMITTLLGCIFTANIKTDKAFATTFNNAGAELKLVGYNGYSPVSYFDSTKQSSIVKSSNYINNNGQKTSQYYMIQTEVSHLFGAYSKGSSSFAPFADYISLADAGLLYAYARVGIVSASSDEKNKVTITLSQEDSIQSITNSQNGMKLEDGTYSPFYYQTQPIAISSKSNITFTYTNNAKSSVWSKANFKLFEPSIIFKTVARQIVFENTNQTVYHNDIVKLNATNDILNVTSGGNLLEYYKNMHKIQYEILEGNSIAKVVGNYLYFEGDVSGTVKIQARALSDSEGNSYLSSQIVTYNYVAQKKSVVATQNFSDGADISGMGIYYLGDNVTLVANAKSGYEFYHWILNGQLIASKSIHFVCQDTNEISLYLIKDISITNVKIKQREYNGTTNAEIESIENSGILPTHNASITGLSLAYYSANAGTKTLLVTSMPSITGTDAVYYRLSSILPEVTGIITPKIVSIVIDDCQKIYGESDPAFTYSTNGILNQENIGISTSRQTGENIGKYIIDATISSANYQAEITKGGFTITQKALDFVSADILKTYDMTNQICFVPKITGVVFGDSITVNIFANFSSQFAGQNILLEIDRFEIVGNLKNNYYLKESTIPVLTGTIKPRNIEVTLSAFTKVYGEHDPVFTCSIEGVLTGDEIEYLITRQTGESIGKYPLYFSQYNPNYEVVLSQEYLTIVQKNITVTANEQTKIYGNQDPTLTYFVEGLVGNDTLSGTLQRAGGEQVGVYTIYLGSLGNQNYSINYITSNFSIITRELQGEVVVEDKIYDKTNQINGFSYQFFNLAFGDIVKLEIFAYYADINAGTHNIIIESYNINNSNYTFSLGCLQSNILPKPIKVIAQNQTKIYGQADQTFLYSVEGLVEKEVLDGNLERMIGENVGTYTILAGSLTSDNNPNYVIDFVFASLTITKRIITIQTASLFKYYGENDPEYIYVVANDCSFAFSDELSDIIVGTPFRTSGETPGVYAFLQGNVRSQNNNYQLIYEPTGSLTIKKIEITITAQNTSKVYGDADPTLTFVVGQTVNEFDFALERQRGEDVGFYSIEPVSLYHPYYQINYISGCLNIVPRGIIIKADDKVKFYGDADPTYTASVSFGILVGDRLEQILTGNMQRQVGEQIGTYSISQGCLEIEKNYNFTFEEGNLTIMPKPINVKANNTSKTYGQEDPIFNYTISQGSLVRGENLQGMLVREAGEELGTYTIHIGTLTANQNYTLTFEGGIFTIEKANVLVVIPTIQKIYGEPDPTISYKAFGLPEGLSWSGDVYRIEGENVGQYNYSANLFNEYCVVTYQKGYFEIIKRVVEIKADSHIITYGEVIPKLTYQITKGGILTGDEITGEIYKVPGETAGVYVLNSTLNLGKNYKIEYIKGSVTILPRQITIFSCGASKIYGQADPTMTYTIFEGEVLPDDILSGVINREHGENIGIYNLVASFSNINYQVKLVGGVFQILPKQVWLHAQVLDKVYDGTLTAYLYNVAVSGLIDSDISLVYNAQNCASFSTSEVGENIEVTLHNISLSGINAGNYKLLLPSLTGNITYQILSSNNISVHSQTNTELHYGVSLLVEYTQLQVEIKDKDIVKQFDISIIDGEKQLLLNDSIEVRMEMKKDYQNIKVYLLNQNGQTTMLDCKFRAGILSFSTSQMGHIVIVADNLIWLDILAVLLPVLFVALIGVWFSTKKSIK